MDKIDLKAKKAEMQKMQQNEGFLGMPVYVEGISDVKSAISELAILIDNQEEYDFDQLKSELTTLNNKLDLAPLFKSLEESIKQANTQNSASQKDIQNKQSEGFSKLIRAFHQIKPPVVNFKANDILAEYRGSDQDISDNISYFGFIHPTGKWYIVRQTGGESATFRYISGAGNYRQGWTRRNQHDYKYFDEINL